MSRAHPRYPWIMGALEGGAAAVGPDEDMEESRLGRVEWVRRSGAAGTQAGVGGDGR